MAIEENKALVRRVLEEIINNGNMAVADELIANDYVYQSPGSPEFRGPEGYKQVVTMYRNAFPDLHLTMDDVIAEGDIVASSFTAKGTHRGELMGVAPTGKQVTVVGLTLTRCAGSKVVEDLEVFDALGMMQQLGAIPAPAEAAAART